MATLKLRSITPDIKRFPQRFSYDDLKIILKLGGALTTRG
jgi:hypothetical protein